MAVVIKEIRIRTVVEKKVFIETDVSAEVYRKIRDMVLDELPLPLSKYADSRRKKER